MAKDIFVIFLLFLFILIGDSFIISEDKIIYSLNRSQYDSLQNIYNTLGGEHWVWGTSPASGTGIPWSFNASSDPCIDNWQGLGCEDRVNESYLTKISLIRHNLTGYLLENIFQNLSTLISLDLSSNNLSGSLPTSISSLFMLSTLNLSRNEFNATLKNLLSSGHSQLRFLDLSSNKFVGNILVKLRDNGGEQSLEH
jgi:Leucine-rich repeat (LRR) protein